MVDTRQRSYRSPNDYEEIPETLAGETGQPSMLQPSRARVRSRTHRSGSVHTVSTDEGQESEVPVDAAESARAKGKRPMREDPSDGAPSVRRRLDSRETTPKLASLSDHTLSEMHQQITEEIRKRQDLRASTMQTPHGLASHIAEYTSRRRDTSDLP